MVNESIFRKIFTWALPLALLSACSDNGSSTEDVESKQESAPLVSRTTAKISVDESHKKINYIYENVSEKCYLENDHFSWHTRDNGYKISMSYQFKGNALILSLNSMELNAEKGVILDLTGGDSEEDFQTLVLTGGTPNELYGTWTQLPQCIYQATTDSIYCFQDQVSKDTTTLHILEGQIITETIYADTKAKTDVQKIFSDFRNSQFMTQLYSCLGTESTCNVKGSSFTVADTAGVDSVLRASNGTVKKISDNLYELTFNQKQFTMEIAKNKIKAKNPQREYLIHVTRGDSTCTLDYAARDVTRDLCEDSNRDYLVVEPEQSFGASDLSFADGYWRDNSIVFSECLAGLTQL